MKEAAPDTTRLRELAKAATSGPWFKWPESNHVCERAQHAIVAACPGKDGDKRWDWGTVHHPEADTEFIAAANPVAVLSLLDRIEELERHNRALLDHIKEDAPLGHG